MHDIGNGLLLRRDIHSLFDAGYVTVSPDLRFEVSRRIKEELENGREYHRRTVARRVAFPWIMQGAVKRMTAAWCGELPLWRAYWLWGVAGNMSFVLLLVLVAIVTDFAPLWLWAAYLASLGWFVLIFGAIWRSGQHYPGPHHWPALARLGVLTGVCRMAGEAVVIASL